MSKSLGGDNMPRTYFEMYQEMEERYKNALNIIGIIINSMPQREIRIPQHLMITGMPEGTRLVTYEDFESNMYVIKVEDSDGLSR